MGSFLVRRLLWAIPVLIVISIITFAMMKAAPGGPWDRDEERGKQLDKRTQQLLNQQFGLDKPVWRQYTSYMFGDWRESPEGESKFVCGAICGNLGPSFKQRGKTIQDIFFKPPTEEGNFFDSKFGRSLQLALYALIFAIIVGIPAGIIAALNQNKPIDYAVTFISNIGIAVPSLVMGLLFIIIFAVGLKLVPVVAKDWDNWAMWVLPIVSLGLATLARVARYMRSSVLDVMRTDYIRTARAKGLRENLVVWRHMLRNALVPVITILGPTLAGLITGAFTVEFIFSFSGIGQDFVRSIGNRDYSMIMGTSLLFAVLIVFANLTVDILYGVVDPRIRLE